MSNKDFQRAIGNYSEQDKIDIAREYQKLKASNQNPVKEPLQTSRKIGWVRMVKGYMSCLDEIHILREVYSTKEEAFNCHINDSQFYGVAQISWDDDCLNPDRL